MPRLYNDDQLPLWKTPEVVVRGAGGWCEMAASPWSRHTDAVKTVSENSSLCVTEIHVVTSFVLKCPINVITSPSPIRSHTM
jgi:hypothetical protein